LPAFHLSLAQLNPPWTDSNANLIAFRYPAGSAAARFGPASLQTAASSGVLPLGEASSCLSDQDSPRVGEFDTDNPSIVASEQAKSMLFFDLSDLSVERRLSEVQSKDGLSKVQLFGQDNNRVQVTYFDVGKHCSEPH
jgi:hypothetical protein